MCIICLWIRDIHVNWRIPFFRRRYEGLYFVPSIIISKKLTNFLATCYNNSNIFFPLNTGFSKGEDEWTLWCQCICCEQYLIRDAISDTDHVSVWHCLLFHGPVTPGLHTLFVLCGVPLRQRHCCRKLDDGYS